MRGLQFDVKVRISNLKKMHRGQMTHGLYSVSMNDCKQVVANFLEFVIWRLLCCIMFCNVTRTISQNGR
jgi:hypothetical protein